MGNLSSTNSSQKISITAGKMLNVQAGGNYTEQQTIKFSRNDLVDTVSALDLNSVFELHGGSKNINLNNIPNRNRYSEYTSTKTMNINGGSRGGVIGGYSSTSEGDLSIIKGMILGRQSGGGCGSSPTAPAPAPAPGNHLYHTQGGCGCETGSVLDGGAFNLGKILAKQTMSSLTESSSYNPLNSMDLTSENMYGGNMSSSTQSLSATSSEMAGGYNNSVLSATSPMTYTQGNNFSATSSVGLTQNGGNNASSSLFSATSPLSISQDGGNLSATSPYAMSQMQGGNLSATSQIIMSQNPNEHLSATSPYAMSQMNGGSMSATSTYYMPEMQGGAAILSATSSLPINYDSLIGGKKKNKGKKEHKGKKERASDSSSTEKSESSGRLLMMEDMDASSSSTGSESEDNSDAVIARALRSDAPSEKTRALERFSSEKQTHKSDKKRKVKDSPSDSSGSSGTSTNSSKSKSTSSKSISSSSTDGDAIAKVNSYKYANLIVTSPNSASISDSLINAKQFYSSENGELFSSESNFLRNNINKNRLR